MVSFVSRSLIGHRDCFAFFLVKAMPLLTRAFFILTAFLGSLVSLASSLQHGTLDSSGLKAEWKKLEATTTNTAPASASSAISAPLKKALGVYRGLLASLDHFKDALDNDDDAGGGGGQDGSGEGAPVGAPPPLLSVDPFEDPFGQSRDTFGHGGSFSRPLHGLWALEEEAAGRGRAEAAWGAAGSAARYARVAPATEADAEAWAVEAAQLVLRRSFDLRGKFSRGLPLRGACQHWNNRMSCTARDVPLGVKRRTARRRLAVRGFSIFNLC